MPIITPVFQEEFHRNNACNFSQDMWNKGVGKKVCNNGLERNVLLSAQELTKNMGMEGDRTKHENLKVV